VTSSAAFNNPQPVRSDRGNSTLELPLGINPNPHMSAGQALLGIGCDLHPRASDSSVTGVTSLSVRHGLFLDLKCIRLPCTVALVLRPLHSITKCAVAINRLLAAAPG
jgi:hypothetical protein